MLTVISPAKRLDWSARDIAMTTPDFQDDADALARIAKRLSVDKLRKLMDISEDLAKLSKDRFARFAQEREATRPAALAFAGDTYTGLEAPTLEPEDLRYAQDHLRILSGLYGLLRPLDAIQAYRLEMGSRLATRRGKSLYAYWGDRLAHALNVQATQVDAKALVNCASVEYFSAVPDRALTPDVITPVFLEDKPGGPKTVSFFAKKARGAMARYIVENRLKEPDDLLSFSTGGYRYEPELSVPGKPAFMRPAEAAQTAAA